MAWGESGQRMVGDGKSETKLVNRKRQYTTLWASRAWWGNLKEGHLRKTEGSPHLPHTLANEKA